MEENLYKANVECKKDPKLSYKYFPTFKSRKLFLRRLESYHVMKNQVFYVTRKRVLKFVPTPEDIDRVLDIRHVRPDKSHKRKRRYLHRALMDANYYLPPYTGGLYSAVDE